MLLTVPTSSVFVRPKTTASSEWPVTHCRWSASKTWNYARHVHGLCAHWRWTDAATKSCSNQANKRPRWRGGGGGSKSSSLLPSLSIWFRKGRNQMRMGTLGAQHRKQQPWLPVVLPASLAGLVTNMATGHLEHPPSNLVHTSNYGIKKGFKEHGYKSDSGSSKGLQAACSLCPPGRCPQHHSQVICGHADPGQTEGCLLLCTAKLQTGFKAAIYLGLYSGLAARWDPSVPDPTGIL